MNLQGKVALISGSSSGVGAATSHRLAALGCSVAVNYCRSESAAQSVVAEIQANGGSALAVQGDVASDADCRRMVATTVDRLGGLDVLVNNAGTTTFVPHPQLEDLTEDIWERTLRVNLMGAFFLTRAAAPALKASEEGCVVMTSSIAGLTTNGSSIAYCASKAGMNSLTRTLAKTLGADGIRVNAVLPGLIDGDWAFNTWGGGDPDQYQQLKDGFAAQTPLSHVVTPDDVAEAIVSLVDGSPWMTGQLITLDGGFTL